jgi:hypothetical protein
MPSWVATTHYVLELLYYISGIVIAGAAVFGLRQLKIGLDQITISKEVARANARRESIRYAAEQCRYYAENVVPSSKQFIEKYQELQLTFGSLQPPPGHPPFFHVQNGEIVMQGYDFKLLDDQWPKISSLAITCLNTLEAFAIPFSQPALRRKTSAFERQPADSVS